MPKLPPGEHELKIFFSVNSQQFIDTGMKILVNNFLKLNPEKVFC